MWLAIPILGAGTLYGVLAAGVGGVKAPAVSDAAEGRVAQKGAGSRMSEAVELAAAPRGTSATQRIVEAYAAWAKDPAALPARRLLLSTLFSEPDIPKKLSAVLAAIEADPTPAEKDPLWEYTVESLTNVWTGDVATRGMDLVLAETRPRALRALVSSFAALAVSERLAELTPAQRQTLTETMINLSPHVPATQLPEVTAALRKLGGNDLADIVEGKGITGKDGHVLESEVAYKNALAETQAANRENGQATP